MDSNRAIAASTEGAVNPNRITAESASRNIEFLRTQAESWLAVFFNVFGSVGRDSRNSVGDVIASWVSIAGESVCCFLRRTPLLIPKMLEYRQGLC